MSQIRVNSGNLVSSTDLLLELKLQFHHIYCRDASEQVEIGRNDYPGIFENPPGRNQGILFSSKSGNYINHVIFLLAILIFCGLYGPARRLETFSF